MSLQKKFPILQNNPGLVYLDNTASVQKPQMVIDEITRFLSFDYSNIHRGSYSLAERSEHIYEQSKKVVAQNIGATDWREVVYTANSNYALNLLAGSLRRSQFFQKGDVVLVSIVEHHANIVPWLILKEEIGIEVKYVQIKDDYSLDFDDLEAKLDEKVKVVSLAHVSNVTGEIFDLERVGKMLRNRFLPSQEWQNSRPLFIVDASQSVPHFQLDVQKIGCDFLFFTGHKVMADSGIGVLWWKREIFENLLPVFSGGWAIRKVEQDCFTSAPLPDRFEIGTPNVTGAASLLAAFQYIEKIGWYTKLWQTEEELVKYSLEKFKEFSQKFPEFHLLGSQNLERRVGVFSFYIEGIHSLDIADYMAENNICIRAGQHCAEPFLTSKNLHHTCRMSLYIYNTREDIDRFFQVLEKAIREFK